MIKKIVLTAYDNINKLKVAEIYDNDTFNESKIYSMMILSGIILTDEENYTGEIVIKSIDGIRKNFTIYDYNKYFLLLRKLLLMLILQYYYSIIILLIYYYLHLYY